MECLKMSGGFLFWEIFLYSEQGMGLRGFVFAYPSERHGNVPYITLPEKKPSAY
jgi:hypothetical protein